MSRATKWQGRPGYVAPVLFNPYTGEPRDARDIASDPQGILIVQPGAPLRTAAPTPPAQQDDEAHSAAVSHLWECLGRWSMSIAQGGKLADLAPPSWLIDAINAATLSRQDDEALEVLREIVAAWEMAPGQRKIIRVSRLLDDARALLEKRGTA